MDSGWERVKLAAWRLLWPLRARLRGGLAPGSIFPDFALADTQGRRHALSDAGGRATVLWFTNLCADCRAQIPALHELVDQAGDRYRVLAISILDPADPLPARVAGECRFPLLLDPEDIVSRRLGLAHPPGACPLTNLFLVSPSGRVLHRGHLSALGPERFRALWRSLPVE